MPDRIKSARGIAEDTLETSVRNIARNLRLETHISRPGRPGEFGEAGGVGRVGEAGEAGEADGFTLIELMIVTAIIAIIASIAVPNLRASRISANEAAAIATLKAVSTAQAQVRSGVAIDSDEDGLAEFGFFQELSGVRNTRTDTNRDGLADADGLAPVTPPVLSRAFGEVDDEGLVQRSGYYFRIYLPGDQMKWEREDTPSKGYKKVSAAYSAYHWACYAWPVSYGNTGLRTFFVNEAGQILVCKNATTKYSGTKKDAPKKDAAVVKGTPGKGRMDDPIAYNAIGQDDNVWTVTR